MGAGEKSSRRREPVGRLRSAVCGISGYLSPSENGLRSSVVGRSFFAGQLLITNH
jgi:hypothetical protein